MNRINKCRCAFHVSAETSGKGEIKKFDPVVCPICGKLFMPAPYHAWRTNPGVANSKRVCSYTCQRASEKQREAERIERMSDFKERRRALYAEKRRKALAEAT